MSREDPTLADAPSLLTRLLSEAMALAKSEIALAKRELSEKLSQAGSGIGLLVGAALIAFTAFHAFAAAAVFGLMALDISAGWSVLIVAGVLSAIALILGIIGRGRLRSDALKLEKTMRNVKADISVIEEATRAKSQR